MDANKYNWFCTNYRVSSGLWMAASQIRRSIAKHVDLVCLYSGFNKSLLFNRKRAKNDSSYLGLKIGQFELLFEEHFFQIDELVVFCRWSIG